MARDAASRPGDGNAFTRFFDRVDSALEPIFGAPLATGGLEQEDAAELRTRPCPVCGHAIFEHTFDDLSGNIVMTCPTSERLPERATTGPLNELGMPAHGRRLERYEQRASAG
ncbi:hypothetical protein M3147_06250 [Agromyces mediolanus]|uniref:hypothetical protein n=1 Tax=Agromyces mediolanus TaxID=41986 RepID=UPI00203C4262|nr:hypothetical protein [Agromyces mediolanus]MCM3656852.1 hypothetical protein [Agromyces mediolanus]